MPHCRGAASSTPRGGVKTPPYDAKDKGAAMARLRAGHARPLRTTVNGSGARVAASPVQPHKNKKRDGHCPVSFSLKRRRKTERLAGACIEWKPPLYKWMPFLGNRQGALVFFLFSCRSEALAFDVLIVHYFCRICKMRTCTTCYIYPTLFCIVCTTVHG